MEVVSREQSPKELYEDQELREMRSVAELPVSPGMGSHLHLR